MSVFDACSHIKVIDRDVSKTWIQAFAMCIYYLKGGRNPQFSHDLEKKNLKWIIESVKFFKNEGDSNTLLK